MEEKKVVGESFSTETLHNFSKNGFDLQTILKNNKSNLSDIFKINYRLLKEVQYKCLLNIIANIEKYLNRNVILSNMSENHIMIDIVLKTENYQFLSNKQKQEVFSILEKLLMQRACLDAILNTGYININNIIHKITKDNIGPYYLQIGLSSEDFKNHNKMFDKPGMTKEGMEPSGFAAMVSQFNDLTIIVYDQEAGNPQKILKHEVRHAKDNLISQSENHVIAHETLAYTSETGDWNKGEILLTQPGAYYFGDNFESFKKEVSKLYKKLWQPDAINLDLLAIINYNQWGSILKTAEMEKYTQGLDNEIVGKTNNPNQTITEFFNQINMDPKNLYGSGTTRKDMTIFRNDFELLENLKKLSIRTKLLKEDISQKIQNNKSLEEVELYQEVYDQIDPEFLKKTNITFKILE